MIGFNNFGCHNADHAQVPGGVAQDDSGWRTTIVLPGNALVHLLLHGLLQGAALLVHVIEEVRQPHGFGRLIGR
jgi:hypothetical protein